MTPEEVQGIGEVIQAGVEAAFNQILADTSSWQARHRAATGPSIERAIRAAVDCAVQECLVNPFPRKGSPRAVMRNARPLIRAAVLKELKGLVG